MYLQALLFIFDKLLRHEGLFMSPSPVSDPLRWMAGLWEIQGKILALPLISKGGFQLYCEGVNSSNSPEG